MPPPPGNGEPGHESSDWSARVQSCSERVWCWRRNEVRRTPCSAGSSWDLCFFCHPCGRSAAGIAPTVLQPDSRRTPAEQGGGIPMPVCVKEQFEGALK